MSAEQIGDDIRRDLRLMADASYRLFMAGLIPGVELERVIGIRTPLLRSYAKCLPDERKDSFLADLPHYYFEENQLHAFILSGVKDFKVCLKEVDRFLPYIDNWATCDQMTPKCFRKHRDELLSSIWTWIKSGRVYSVRFAVKMLMDHFLDESFESAYPEAVSLIRSEEYYVNMMIAWYFATALAKQYDIVLPYLINRRLSVWTHNKAIQKALESYRISDEQKAFLRGLKIK